MFIDELSAEPLAVVIFVFFVIAVLGISYWFARRAKSASGYFAAGGNIHWSVNGVAFAGDYLSRRLLPRHRRHDRHLRF